MARETVIEETLGRFVFSSGELRYFNSVPTTKKRQGYTDYINSLIWQRAISGSSPLLFQYRENVSPSTTITDSSCGNLEWRNTIPPRDEQIIQGHAHFKKMLSPMGNVQYTVLCPSPSPVTASDDMSARLKQMVPVPLSSVIPRDASQSQSSSLTNSQLSNPQQWYTVPSPGLTQITHEEYICNEGAPSANGPRLHIVLVSPLYTDFVVAHEGKDRKSSHFVKTLFESHFFSIWNKYPERIKEEKQRRKEAYKQQKVYDPSTVTPGNENAHNENVHDEDGNVNDNQFDYPSETNSLYDRLPESKHTELKPGDCLFIPSFWWVYMEMEGATHTPNIPTPMMISRSQYKPHSALFETFIRTIRENLSKK